MHTGVASMEAESAVLSSWPSRAALVVGAVGLTLGAAWLPRWLRRNMPPAGFASALHRALYERVLDAEAAIRGVTVETPLLRSGPLAARTGADRVWLKLECDQVTRSFKARGAASAVAQNYSLASKRGVVTASTGNHARAVLHAVSSLLPEGSPALRVFVPRSIDASKLERLRALKAAVTVVDSDDCERCEAAARSAAASEGAVFVSPYNDELVIGGQGTVGLEIERQCAEEGVRPDVVLVTVGGGGLIAGVAAAVKARIPGVQVIGCQPRSNACMQASLTAGRILGEGEYENGDTLSDGSAGGIEAGSVTFEACRDLVDDWILVEEEAILDAVALVLHEHGRVIEGAAGTAVAALVSSGSRFAGKRVAVVICGGNASPDLVLRAAAKTA